MYTTDLFSGTRRSTDGRSVSSSVFCLRQRRQASRERLKAWPYSELFDFLPKTFLPFYLFPNSLPPPPPSLYLSLRLFLFTLSFLLTLTSLFIYIYFPPVVETIWMRWIEISNKIELKAKHERCKDFFWKKKAFREISAKTWKVQTKEEIRGKREKISEDEKGRGKRKRAYFVIQNKRNHGTSKISFVSLLYCKTFPLFF